MRNKIFTLSCLLVFAFGSVLAQETETETKKVDKPVRSPFESGYLIDNQTTVIQPVNTLEFAIQHKFGTVENGRSDLWGLYASGANIRLGLSYVVAKNIQIGIGATKENMTTDFNAKWTILEQTRNNTVPVALAFYGNIAIDGRDKDQFHDDFNSSDRLSSFAQVIVGRKFSDELSLQTGLSFSHYNLINKGMYHDKVGVHFNGRYKVSPQGSIIFNLDMPLDLGYLDSEADNYENPEPNFSFGYEISTSTHAFQIYMGNSNGLVQQDIMVNNHSKIDLDNYMIGFTITRLWNF
ncbi:DUF5777 family beta-barrel protein [Ancylomarina sp. YFZ004]